MPSDTKRILVTGAMGQIGTELTSHLRERYGADHVIGTDIRSDESTAGPSAILDVTDRKAVTDCLRTHRVDTVYHLAAILSAKGEQSPGVCWRVNMEGTINVLDAATELNLRRVIVPSSIAVYGPEAPKNNTPQATHLFPRTMYGITKASGELLGAYYVAKHDLDVRGLRFPGIISSETAPGGGTTDYAVEIFFEAARSGTYTCFVREDTTLPMMYMPDAIRATIDLAETDFDRLVDHTCFNVAAMSFSAGELAAEIQRHLPHFTCRFVPDRRQAIADSWPRSIDDSAARTQWGWKPAWDLPSMTHDMLSRLGALP